MSAVVTGAWLGGDVAKKKFDPLWEIVDERVALQGQEPDVDAHCPYCNVTVHLGSRAMEGQKVSCGLCGGVSQVRVDDGGAHLEPLPHTQAG